MSDIFIVKLELDNPGDFDPWNLYVLKCGPYFKVGISNDVASRRLYLQTGNPFTITIVSKRRVRRVFARRFEMAVHSHLHAYKHRGEWFLAPWPIVKEALAAAAVEMRQWERAYRKSAETKQPYGEPELPLESALLCDPRAPADLRSIKKAKKTEMLQRLERLNG